MNQRALGEALGPGMRQTPKRVFRISYSAGNINRPSDGDRATPGNPVHCAQMRDHISIIPFPGSYPQGPRGPGVAHSSSDDDFDIEAFGVRRDTSYSGEEGPRSPNGGPRPSSTGAPRPRAGGKGGAGAGVAYVHGVEYYLGAYPHRGPVRRVACAASVPEPPKFDRATMRSRPSSAVLLGVGQEYVRPDVQRYAPRPISARVIDTRVSDQASAAGQSTLWSPYRASGGSAGAATVAGSVAPVEFTPSAELAVLRDSAVFGESTGIPRGQGGTEVVQPRGAPQRRGGPGRGAPEDARDITASQLVGAPSAQGRDGGVAASGVHAARLPFGPPDPSDPRAPPASRSSGPGSAGPARPGAVKHSGVFSDSDAVSASFVTSIASTTLRSHEVQVLQDLRARTHRSVAEGRKRLVSSARARSAENRWKEQQGGAISRLISESQVQNRGDRPQSASLPGQVHTLSHGGDRGLSGAPHPHSALSHARLDDIAARAAQKLREQGMTQQEARSLSARLSATVSARRKASSPQFEGILDKASRVKSVTPSPKVTYPIRSAQLQAVMEAPQAPGTGEAAETAEASASSQDSRNGWDDCDGGAEKLWGERADGDIRGVERDAQQIASVRGRDEEAEVEYLFRAPERGRPPVPPGVPSTEISRARNVSSNLAWRDEPRPPGEAFSIVAASAPGEPAGPAAERAVQRGQGGEAWPGEKRAEDVSDEDWGVSGDISRDLPAQPGERHRATVSSDELQRLLDSPERRDRLNRRSAVAQGHRPSLGQGRALGLAPSDVSAGTETREHDQPQLSTATSVGTAGAPLFPPFSLAQSRPATAPAALQMQPPIQRRRIQVVDDIEFCEVQKPPALPKSVPIQSVPGEMTVCNGEAMRLLFG